MNSAKTSTSGQPSALTFTKLYDTFVNGKPIPVPYVIDGLLTQGGFSILGGKSKQGKSSLSRYEAVCVSKGIPFLGRDTTQGDVILFNLEDQMSHVDNCFKVLGYDEKTDGRIHIVESLRPTVEENIEMLRNALVAMPDVRLVIVDTIPKFIRVNDLNDYMLVLRAVEQLSRLAREFPRLHIQGLAHCKKLKTDDPFDGLLGSTALRGEADTNIAMYEEKAQRVIATETKSGRRIPPTLLRSEMVESAGEEVVTSFSLDTPFADWQKIHADKSERKRRVSHEERIIAYLTDSENKSARQALLLDEVDGKDTLKIAAIKRLVEEGVVSLTGKKQSSTDPITLHLNTDSLGVYGFMNQFAPSEKEGA